MRPAIVIPAYNEASTIAELVRELTAYGDVIVVNDASRDETANLASSGGAMSVISHATTSGYDAALRTGFRWALDHDYDVVLSIDADRQHDPTLVPLMLQPILDEQASYVLGIRDHPARIAEHLFSAYTKYRFGIPDILCGLKAFSVSPSVEYASAMNGQTVGTGLALALARSGLRPALVPVQVADRPDASRFGSGVRANALVLRALLGAIVSDLRNVARTRFRKRGD